MTYFQTYFDMKECIYKKRDDYVSKLWPADSFSVIMRPAQGFEFDMPGLNGTAHLQFPS